MPFVSIIVPVYNTMQYLPRCIESILNQTHKNFELILIDDGSTDDSGDICEFYKKKDNRIKVIHTKNEGVSKARNNGVKNASGYYISFCDSDDYYSPYWIELLLKIATQNQADCVSVILNKRVENTLVNICQDKELIDYIVHRLLQSDGWEIWNRLYKTEIIKNYDINFCVECENYGEDLSFNLQYCLYCKKIVVINGNGYHHTTRSDSIMGSNKRKIRFNALNEVSYSLFARLEKENNKQVMNYFPLIHYLIINNQYRLLIKQCKINELNKEVSKVKKISWMKKYVKMYLLSSKKYKRFFVDKKEWELSLLESHHLLHENYQLLRIERKVKGLQL